MGDIAIKVENLGKKYTIKHNETYKTFREELIELPKKVLNRFNFSKTKNLKNNGNTEEFWALKDINFEIKKGDKVGIIGRNGAGKSTLLKLISRITEPTTGKITLNGRVGTLLEVGTGFHPELTGRENIFLNGAILGMTREEIKKKFDEIVAFAGVEKFLDTPVKRYSSGMYVRLAFSVAAHLNTEILLVDEVLAVGDVEFQKKSLGKMDEVSKKEGRTILFVSHNMAAIQKLCDKGILLEEGFMLTQGSINKVCMEYSKLIKNKKKVISTLSTDAVDILDIKLCDGNQKDLIYIDTNTEIYVNIMYKVKKQIKIGFTLNLIRDGNFVFQSINNYDPLFKKTKNIGTYLSICKIPKNFLNNGEYSIGLTVFENHYSNPKDFEDVLFFQIEDNPAIRGDYMGGLRGCVRVKLDWETYEL